MPVREYKWRDFGQRLKAARRRAEITQQRVADLIGVQTQTVWYWESGRSKPTYERLAKLAALLNATVDSLLTDTDAPGSEDSAIIPANRVRGVQEDPSVDAPVEPPPSTGTDGILRPDDPAVPAPAERGIADVARPESVRSDNEEVTPRDIVVRRSGDSIADLLGSLPWDQSEPAFALRAAYPNLSEISRRLIANFIRQVEEQEILENENIRI